MMDDLISRQQAIDAISCNITVTGRQNAELVAATIGTFADRIKALPSAQPDASKYEYHYDHTDCIWYGDGSNKCPSTCSQYRDGWNDAMQYIFCNGKGYRPYRRDGHHE